MSVRVGSFLAVTVLALPVPLLLLLLLAGDPLASGARWVLAMVAIIFAVLWFSTVRKVLALDPMGR